MGLQWEDFLGKCSSKLLRLFGLYWASKGVKWCKSEGVKEKLTPHSYIFFGLPRGVKWCKSEGVKDKLPPNSYIVLSPMADQKRCKSGGLICLLPPHFYTILPPLEAQCSPKRRKSFELHFPKKSSHCSPTLTSFWAEKFNPGTSVSVRHWRLELHIFVVRMWAGAKDSSDRPL